MKQRKFAAAALALMMNVAQLIEGKSVRRLENHNHFEIKKISNSNYSQRQSSIYWLVVIRMERISVHLSLAFIDWYGWIILKHIKPTAAKS